MHVSRRHVAQSVERRNLEVEVRGSKPALGTWRWGRIPPNQPYPKGAAPAATALLAVWWPEFSEKRINIVKRRVLVKNIIFIHVLLFYH